jgi:hypothetical protein
MKFLLRLLHQWDYSATIWSGCWSLQSRARNPRKPKSQRVERRSVMKMSEWVKDTPIPLLLIGKWVGHRDMGRRQRLGAVGGGGARPTVGLCRPTPPRVCLPPAFCNGSLTATWCPVQVPRSRSAHKVAQRISRFSQAQILFSKNLFKREIG